MGSLNLQVYAQSGVLQLFHETHNACVCTIHQNAVLMCNASDLNVTYHGFIAKVVCDLQNKHCMVHRCDKCPGKNQPKAYLKEKFELLHEGEDH